MAENRRPQAARARFKAWGKQDERFLGRLGGWPSRAFVEGRLRASVAAALLLRHSRARNESFRERSEGRYGGRITVPCQLCVLPRAWRARRRSWSRFDPRAETPRQDRRRPFPHH